MSMFDNKLDKFPHVFYINLDKDVERNEYMQKYLTECGIRSYTRVPGVLKSKESILKYMSTIECIEKQDATRVELAATIAHLNGIKALAESEHDVAVIMEDDIDFSLTRYWRFTWEDLYTNLPTGWQTVQLSRSNLNKDIDKSAQLYVKRWERIDFSAAAYLMTRERAREIVDFYFTKGNLALGIFAGTDKPVADHVVFSYSNDATYSLNIVYTCNGTVSRSNIHMWHEPEIATLMQKLEEEWKMRSPALEEMLNIK